MLENPNENRMGADAVLRADPRWRYQANDNGPAGARTRRDYMITCLLEGMRKAVIKPVNYNKLREVTRDPSENPALFQARLAEAMRKYANLDLDTNKGRAILAVHFISKSTPDIRQKLQKLDQGPQTPFPVLLDMAFKVFFNNREEASRNRREHREKIKKTCSILCS